MIKNSKNYKQGIVFLLQEPVLVMRDVWHLARPQQKKPALWIRSEVTPTLLWLCSSHQPHRVSNLPSTESSGRKKARLAGNHFLLLLQRLHQQSLQGRPVAPHPLPPRRNLHPVAGICLLCLCPAQHDILKCEFSKSDKTIPGAQSAGKRWWWLWLWFNGLRTFTIVCPTCTQLKEQGERNPI